MANRVYIIPRRNDLAGINMCLHDLKPNAGQKNGVYDGTPQNIYISEMCDRPGATVVNGTQYVSGSFNTTLTADAVADDTTGGGNNVNAVATTTFGLAAYLKDRVHRAGIAALGNGELAFAECNAAAALIVDDAEAGVTLDITRINAHLAATVDQTDLTGASGNSVSFGAVEDIIRILSGEVYRVPALTIIESAAGAFQTLAQRQVFVAAQTPAIVATQGQFVASGGFLTPTDVGFRRRPLLARSGAVNISSAMGQIHGYKQNVTVLNPDFAYTAGEVTAWRPRAYTLDGTAVPSTGVYPAMQLYTNEGVAL